MKVIQGCKCCGESTKARYRDFSPHAWAMLLHWEEIEYSAIGQPICQSCYDDLRELLIERSGELDSNLGQEKIQEVRFVVDQTLSQANRETPIAS